MEINVNITRGDYADFNKYYYQKKMLKKTIWLSVIIVLVVPLIAYIGQDFSFLSYIELVAVYGPVFVMINLIIMPLTMHLTKILPAENGSILGKKKFLITDEGLIEEAENNTNLQKWKGIKTVELSNKSVFIFVDNMVAYIIPKRFFKNKTEMLNFIAIIEEKAQNASKIA